MASAPEWSTVHWLSLWLPPLAFVRRRESSACDEGYKRRWHPGQGLLFVCKPPGRHIHYPQKPRHTGQAGGSSATRRRWQVRCLSFWLLPDRLQLGRKKTLKWWLLSHSAFQTHYRVNNNVFPSSIRKVNIIRLNKFWIIHIKDLVTLPTSRIRDFLRHNRAVSELKAQSDSPYDCNTCQYLQMEIISVSLATNVI